MCFLYYYYFFFLFLCFILSLHTLAALLAIIYWIWANFFVNTLIDFHLAAQPSVARGTPLKSTSALAALKAFSMWLLFENMRFQTVMRRFGVLYVTSLSIYICVYARMCVCINCCCTYVCICHVAYTFNFCFSFSYQHIFFIFIFIYIYICMYVFM